VLHRERLKELGFASPRIIMLSTESTNQMQLLLKFLPFKYSSTCFGHPHAHHQELQQLQ
jgi:hypothetical protein